MAKVSAAFCVYSIEMQVPLQHTISTTLLYYSISWEQAPTVYSIVLKKNMSPKWEFNAVDEMIILRFRQKVGEIHAMLS